MTGFAVQCGWPYRPQARVRVELQPRNPEHVDRLRSLLPELRDILVARADFAVDYDCAFGEFFLLPRNRRTSVTVFPATGKGHGEVPESVTHWIGSPRSERFIRMYDKRAEQGSVGPPFTRVEVSFSHPKQRLQVGGCIVSTRGGHVARATLRLHELPSIAHGFDHIDVIPVDNGRSPVERARHQLAILYGIRALRRHRGIRPRDFDDWIKSRTVDTAVVEHPDAVFCRLWPTRAAALLRKLGVQP